jgi:uncharacterized protein involved in outer membrane biogenesis
MAEPAAPTPQDAAPAPRPRRRWKRRLLLGTTAFVLLVVAAPYALSIAPVRRWIASKVSDALSRRVTIGGVTARWWSGIELRDVEVHNPPGFEGPPLLAADRVHVDVAAFKALFGKIDADARVERPAVTLIRTADGRRNTDGLFEEKPEREKGSPPTLVVKVTDGRVVSHDAAAPGEAAGKPRTDAVEQVGATWTTSAGAKHAELHGVVKGAGHGGEDVSIDATADLDADGGGRVKFTLPPVDLARVSRLVEAATGAARVTGEAQASGEITLDASGTPKGTLEARLTRFSANVRGGDLAVASVRLVLDSRPGPDGGSKIAVDLVAQDISATGYSRRDGGLRDPRLHAFGTVVSKEAGSYDFGKEGTALRIEESTVVRGQVSGSVSGLRTERPAADLKADLSLTLTPTLARVLGLVTSPDDDARGAASANLTLASGGDGAGAGALRFDGTVGVTGLSVGGAQGKPPYADPQVTAALQGSWDGAAGVLSLDARTRVTGQAVTVTLPEGMRIETAATPKRVRGKAVVDADLARLAGLRAMVPALDAFAGGSVHATVASAEGGPGSRFVLDASARGLALKDSGAGATPRDVSAKATVVLGDAGTTIEDAVVSGAGIEVRGKAEFATRGGESSLSTAHADAKGDLDAARPLLVPLLGMRTDAALSGRVEAKADLADSGGTRTLVAHAAVTNLRYGGSARRAPLEEPSAVVDARLEARAATGTYRVETLTLRATSLSLDVDRGGTFASRPDEDGVEVDLAATVDGDAQRLARHVRAVLGEGWDDLEGEGRLHGRAIAAGPTASRGRDLRLDVDLSFRKFESGGLALSDGKITAKRPSPMTPLVVHAQSGVNGGTFVLDGSCRLGVGTSPWDAKATVAGADASPLVTATGFARYLPMILPSIVPAGKTSRVLSGRLDATVDLSSAAISDPALSDGLRGDGSLTMTQGSVSDSTLFGSLAGEGAGKALGLLAQAVPTAGRWFREVGKAVLFTELSSRFQVGDRKIHLDEVKMSSEAYSTKFSGDVAFDGRLDLKVPLVIGGDLGGQIGKYVKNSTIPLRVTGSAGSPKVRPDLELSNLSPGGLLDDLLKKVRK